jgi:hypothetical protein
MTTPTVTTPATTAAPTSLPPTLTPEATPLPPIPTADFAPAEIVGAWTRADPERGNLFLIFSETRTYRAAHGEPDSTVHAGRYTLDGRLFTFQDGWNCAPLPDDTPGKYVVRLIRDRGWLYLGLYQDDCPDRPSAVRSVRWTRFVPTPAAMP